MKPLALKLTDAQIEHIYRLNDDIILADELDLQTIFPPYFRTPTTTVMVLENGYIRGRTDLIDTYIQAPAMTIILPNQILEIREASEDVCGKTLFMSENFERELHLADNYELQSSIRTNSIISLNDDALQALNLYFSMFKASLQHKENPNLMEMMINLTRAFFFGAGFYFHTDVSKEAVAISRADSIVRDFLHLAKENCIQERRLDFYADKLCLNMKYMANTIRERTGKSASRWIEEYVVLEAKTLLTAEQLTVGEVAERLCFPDQSTFGKYFRRITGISPKAFQKKL